MSYALLLQIMLMFIILYVLFWEIFFCLSLKFKHGNIGFSSFEKFFSALQTIILHILWEVLLLFWHLGLVFLLFMKVYNLPRHSLNTDNVNVLASMVMLERGIFLLSSPCSLKAYWIMRQPKGNNLQVDSVTLFKVDFIWRNARAIP